MSELMKEIGVTGNDIWRVVAFIFAMSFQMWLRRIHEELRDIKIEIWNRRNNE